MVLILVNTEIKTDLQQHVTLPLMFPERYPHVIDDLRFSLQVLQEHSGLGLDSEHAMKIRSVLLQQIERAEAALRRCPTVAGLEQVGDASPE